MTLGDPTSVRSDAASALRLARVTTDALSEGLSPAKGDKVVADLEAAGFLELANAVRLAVSERRALLRSRGFRALGSVR